LVTGFLGSGKTTLVNHLIRTPTFERAAVVVGEYGEIGIDHVLIAAPRERVRVIDGGCLCGHVHEEVASSLLDLWERRNCGVDFDWVLIETSGLADPVPIVQILLTDPHVGALYQLRSVIAVADGKHGATHLSRHEESVKQAAIADILAISKTDLAAAEEVDCLALRLRALNPAARQVRISRGEIDPVLVGEHRGFAVAPSAEAAQHWLSAHAQPGGSPAAARDPAVATFTLEYEPEITVPGFVLWMNLLAGFRGAGLLRVKGILNIEGKPYAIQAVQTVIDEPVPLTAWPDDDRRSRLVFITRGMDAEDIRRTFAALSFDAGRAARNPTIEAADYARFRDTIALFRQSPARAAAPN
jgi:G3E family GTPase